MSKQWIFKLNELGSEHNDLVGKKCANLGELHKLGMKVPPGFAISVDGYEKFMAESGIGEQIRKYAQENKDNLGNVDKQVEASRILRSLIQSGSMPEEMSETIGRYYRELCDQLNMKDVAVAVRSSGAVSMPGQMETYLNVKGKLDVINKIIRVWGSAFTTRAIAFRIEKKMEMEKAPIGVAVLKMVNAKCAGVVLTLSPTTGDTSKAVVEANWGLGESVVSGEMTPDQFIVNKESGDYECTISSKTKMISFQTSGIRTADVPKHLQCESCLQPSELAEIVRIAKQVENHFGAPQDMEWVIDQDLQFPDNLFWVQARPAKFAKRKESESEYLAELMSRIFKM